MVAVTSGCTWWPLFTWSFLLRVISKYWVQSHTVGWVWPSVAQNTRTWWCFMGRWVCVPLWLTSFWPVSALPAEELEPRGMTCSTCCLANVVARWLGPANLFPWHKRLSESCCCMLSSLTTGKNNCLFVEDAIHKVRLLPWCPMWLLTAALCSRVGRKPWGTPQTASGAWHGLCLCCHRSSSPFATGNGSRRCSRG